MRDPVIITSSITGAAASAGGAVCAAAAATHAVDKAAMKSLTTAESGDPRFTLFGPSPHVRYRSVMFVLPEFPLLTRARIETARRLRLPPCCSTATQTYPLLGANHAFWGT